ncbi:MAG: hypothetical protein LQ340_006481, partial [Diploschistes diacapsis]
MSSQGGQTPTPHRFIQSRGRHPPSASSRALPSSTSRQFAPTPRFASSRPGAIAKEYISDGLDSSPSSPLVSKRQGQCNPYGETREEIEDGSSQAQEANMVDLAHHSVAADLIEPCATSRPNFTDPMQVYSARNDDTGTSSDLEELLFPHLPCKRRRLTPSPPGQQRPPPPPPPPPYQAFARRAPTTPASPTTFATATPPRIRPIIISSSPPRSPSSPNPSLSPSQPLDSPPQPSSPTTARRFRLNQTHPSPSTTATMPETATAPTLPHTRPRAGFILPSSTSAAEDVNYDASLAALLFSPHRSRRGRPPGAGTGGAVGRARYSYVQGGMAES